MHTLNGDAMNQQVTEFINAKATTQQAKFRLALTNISLSPQVRVLLIELVGALLKESMYDLVPVVFGAVTGRLLEKMGEAKNAK